MDYSNIKQVHRKAMMLAQDAYVFVLHGDEQSALRLYESAFELEREAAMTLVADELKEPTRSVLFRSAASLAVKCKKFREAEKMVALGLAGNPPDEIANELRDLYEDINFFRHLELKDTELDNSEFLLSFRNGQQKGVALKRKQETFKDEINKIKADKNEVENQQAPEFVKLIGTLKIANAKQNTIEIMPIKGANPFNQKIKVSEGLSDVVKMYFDEVVEVNLIKKDGKIYELKEIDRA